MIKLTITGRIPSKKNSKQIIKSKGRPMLIPSKNYTAWEKDAVIQATKQVEEKVLIIKQVQIDFYFPDKRRTDLTNKAESIMDMLVKAGIIIDDAWQYVPSILLESKGSDKDNPRADIRLLT